MAVPVGKVIGYLLAEALMLYFTGATANAAKWLGKLGKVGGKLAAIFRKIGGKLADLRPRRTPDIDLPERPGGGRKARELPFAVASAALIADTHDKADSPVSVLLASLQPLRVKFTWIRRFRAARIRPGHYRIVLVASEHTVDRDYTPGTEEEDPALVRQRRVDELIDEFAAMDRPSAAFARWKDQLIGSGFSQHEVAEIVYQGTLKRGSNPWGGNWKKYLEEISVSEYPGRPQHAHHLVQKVGGGAAGARNRELLREVGINPLLGRENLAWAPNIKFQHGRNPQADLLAMLEPVRGNRVAIVEVLERWAEIARKR